MNNTNGRLLSVTLIAASIIAASPASRAASYTTRDTGDTWKYINRPNDWPNNLYPPSGSNHNFTIAPGFVLSATVPFTSTYVGGTSVGTANLRDGTTLAIQSGGSLVYNGSSPLNQTVVFFSGTSASLSISKGGHVFAPRITTGVAGALSVLNVSGSLAMLAGGFAYGPLAGTTGGGSNYLINVNSGGVVDFAAPNLGQNNAVNTDRNRYTLNVAGGRFLFSSTTAGATILANGNGRGIINLSGGDLDLAGREVYWAQNSGTTNAFNWSGGTLSNVYGISGTGSGQVTSGTFIRALSTSGSTAKIIDINNQRISPTAKTWTVGAASGTGGIIQFDVSSTNNNDNDKIAVIASPFSLSSAVKAEIRFRQPVKDPLVYKGKTYGFFTGLSGTMNSASGSDFWWHAENTYYVEPITANSFQNSGTIAVKNIAMGTIPPTGSGTNQPPQTPQEPPLYTATALAQIPPLPPSPSPTPIRLNVKDYGAIGDGASHKKANWSSDTAIANAGALTKLTGTATALVERHTNRDLIFGPGHPHNHPPGLGDDDEADWVAIQAALIDAGERNKLDPTKVYEVYIPAATEYLVNRQVWIYSNTILTWEDDTFVRINKASANGTVFTNFNLYFRSATPPYFPPNEYLMRNVIINNPHVDGGSEGDGNGGGPFLNGENGFGFARGAQDVTINGGVIKNTKWGEWQDTNPQGGRALQFETGVKNCTVNGTRVENASMGVSSASGLSAYAPSGTGAYNRYAWHLPPLPPEVYNISWNIRINDIHIKDTDLPFFFGNLHYGHDEYETDNSQMVIVTSGTVIDSGLMRANSNPSTMRRSTGDQSGIIGLQAAKNISVSNLHIANSSTYSVITPTGTYYQTGTSGTFFTTPSGTYSAIGGVVKGHGTNLSIKDIEFNGKALSYFAIGDYFFGGKANGASITKQLTIHNFTASGTTDYGLSVISSNTINPLATAKIEVTHGAFTSTGAFLNPNLGTKLDVESQKTIRIDAEPGDLHGTLHELLQ